MRFEKWQALGNDYVIVEERRLAFELTPARVRALCAPHLGIGSDGVLLLRESDEARVVAEIRIYNPDGSEAELSGNGVRQAVMYLRRSGWVEDDSFRCSRPPVRSTAHRGRAGTMGIGRPRLRAPHDFPRVGRTAPALCAPPAATSLPVRCRSETPQCAIEVGEELETLDLQRFGPDIESHELFPRRTNVSFWRRTGDDSIRARIFERGVGETMSSGTGATGAAIAAVVSGARSPVTVAVDGGELAVEVGGSQREPDGWRPVYGVSSR